ncbi:MAG: hypothetical protein JXC36_07690 [Candidatus Atribacteria bacterium]|nr:hypothetical protein [Candidatus Atribacteria bacterium]
MNLFWKKSHDDFFKGEETILLNQDDETSESDKKIPSELSEISKTKEKEKSLYQPSPELFRRLIEGTSFDHRERIENKQPPMKIDSHLSEIIQSREKPVFEEKFSLKSADQRVLINPTVSRKKFIKKERENRLGSLVFEVLGQPPINKQDG